MNLIQILAEKKLINPPYFLPDNICYLVTGGSKAYGVESESSDTDLLGVCFPTRSILFPHEAGFIKGFGTSPPNFETYQEHHIFSEGKEYDISIHSIVKFFELCRTGNPNLIDILFAPEDCILTLTKSAMIFRDNRRLFLSKLMIPKFYGFARNHIRNIHSYKAEGKRKELVEKFGYDTKDLAHTIRTMLAIKQILETLDYDIRKDRVLVQAIRDGKFSLKEGLRLFEELDLEVKKLESSSLLQEKPDEQELKSLLIKCLESHYGSLDRVINDDNKSKQVLREIYNTLNRNLGAF